MRSSMYLATASYLSMLVSAASIAEANALTNFYLVTTTQSTCAFNSSNLANVSATSLYEAFMFSNPYLLRLIGPGYNSLPQFNLTDGTLATFIEGPVGGPLLDYRSAPPVAGEDLQFFPQQESGDLALYDGHLLGVGGQTTGWTICDQYEESIISWKGTNGTCVPVFIQAVAKPPY